jgi:sialidase-1
VSTPVFVPGTFGAETYRIPALARTPSGTLIAVAEARTGGDCDKKWLVARRSLDNGTTWLPQEDVWGRDLPGSLFASNPTIGFHPATGAVVLTFISASAAQCSPGIDSWVMVDGGSAGARWSAPVNISAALGEWRGAEPGPGTLAALPSGRLAFPVHRGAYRADGIVLSDDGGATWVTSAAAFANMDEAALAPAPNGSLVLNMRNAHANPCDCRATSRSDDGGRTWSALRFDAALVEPVCQASLVRVGAAMYFSNPASTSARANLTVRRSDDGGTTWRARAFLVQAAESAGYSCMAPFFAASVGGADYGSILFETRVNQTLDGISFGLFPLDM